MLYITIIFSILFLLAGYKVVKFGNTLQLYPFDLRETIPLRGILAVCVFLTHLCPHLDGASPWLSDPCNWGPPSVACFFMLAGYGLAYSVKAKGPAYLDGFFRKRLSRLIWPFAVMAVIYQSYKIIGGTFSWHSLLLEPSPLSWFIYALLIWYVGFYVCFKNSRSRQSSIVRVWIFTAVYMAVTVKMHWGYYWISILPMPMAMTYVFYEEAAKDFIRKRPRFCLLAMIGLFAVVMGYTLFAIYVRHLPGWGPLVYNTLPVWVVYLTYILGGPKTMLTNFLGRISYEIYIVHGFIVRLLADIVIVGNPHLNSVCVILLLLAITVASAWTLHSVCRRIP